jgi:hypothetical protein
LLRARQFRHAIERRDFANTLACGTIAPQPMLLGAIGTTPSLLALLARASDRAARRRTEALRAA